MKNSKLMKELVPIAALLLFIIVVLVMCAVSARQKKGQSGTGPDTEAVQETESETESGGETAESTEEASGETGENTGKEDPVEVQETIELDAEEPVETESAPDAVKASCRIRLQCAGHGAGKRKYGDGHCKENEYPDARRNDGLLAEG